LGQRGAPLSSFSPTNESISNFLNFALDSGRKHSKLGFLMRVEQNVDYLLLCDDLDAGLLNWDGVPEVEDLLEQSEDLTGEEAPEVSETQEGQITPTGTLEEEETLYDYRSMDLFIPFDFDDDEEVATEITHDDQFDPDLWQFSLFDDYATGEGSILSQDAGVIVKFQRVSREIRKGTKGERRFMTSMAYCDRGSTLGYRWRQYRFFSMVEYSKLGGWASLLTPFKAFQLLSFVFDLTQIEENPLDQFELWQLEALYAYAETRFDKSKESTLNLPEPTDEVIREYDEEQLL